MRSRVQRAAASLLLAIVYALGAKLALAAHAQAGLATLIWPPAGIALAALLRYPRLWPGVAIGVLLTGIGTDTPLSVTLAVAAGNTTAAALVARWLGRLPGFSRAMWRPRDVAALVLAAGLVGAALSATVGAVAVVAAGRAPAAQLLTVWRTWWLGDLVADLVVTPALLSFVPWPPMRRMARWAEALGVALLATAASLVVFSRDAPAGWALSLGYVQFVPLAWAALRFGVRGTAAVSFLASLVAVCATAAGAGPFAAGELGASLLPLQLFMAMVAMTFLFVGAVSDDRLCAVSELQSIQEELERRISVRTAALVQANQDLERSSAQLAEAQRLAHVGSWELELPSGESVWSDELYRIYGLRPGEIPPSYDALLSMQHPEDRHLLDGAVQRVLRDGGALEVVRRIVRRDGSVRLVLTRAQRQDDAAGRAQRLLGVAQDITEKRAAEQALERARDELEERVRQRTTELTSVAHALEEAVQARDTFLSIASHELRTPLSALQLQLGTLQRGLRGAAAADAAMVLAKLETVRRQVERLSTLIDNLLDVSRITAGRLQIELDEVDVAAVAHEVASRHEAELRAAGCRLELDSRNRVLGIWDRMRLEQILSNLLSNAIKYGRGSPIELRVDADDTWAWIIVRDHGIGIAPENHARIFERFERVTAQRGVGGLGLGLWIVRQIVEALGGRIEVASEVGQGATFTVLLPRWRGEPHRAAGEPALPAG